MNVMTMFQCEYCHKIYEHSGDALKCEMQCLDLTEKEYLEYTNLKLAVGTANYRVAMTKNKTTDEMYDKSITNLIAFEEAHGIKAVT